MLFSDYAAQRIVVTKKEFACCQIFAYQVGETIKYVYLISFDQFVQCGVCHLELRNLGSQT